MHCRSIYIDISLLRLRGRCHARFTAVVVKLNGGHQSVLPTYTGPLSSDVTQVVQPIPSSFIRTHCNWISFIHISDRFICLSNHCSDHKNVISRNQIDLEKGRRNGSIYWPISLPHPLDKCVIEIRSIQLNNFQAFYARCSFIKNSLTNKYHCTWEKQRDCLEDKFGALCWNQRLIISPDPDKSSPHPYIACLYKQF